MPMGMPKGMPMGMTIGMPMGMHMGMPMCMPMGMPMVMPMGMPLGMPMGMVQWCKIILSGQDDFGSLRMNHPDGAKSSCLSPSLKHV